MGRFHVALSLLWHSKAGGPDKHSYSFRLQSQVKSSQTLKSYLLFGRKYWDLEKEGVLANRISQLFSVSAYTIKPRFQVYLFNLNFFFIRKRNYERRFPNLSNYSEYSFMISLNLSQKIRNAQRLRFVLDGCILYHYDTTNKRCRTIKWGTIRSKGILVQVQTGSEHPWTDI